MKVEIKVVEDNAGTANEELNDLIKWLQDENIKSLKADKETISSPDKMGDVETILALLFIARPILVEAIKSINVWVKERKPKAKIKLIDYEEEKEFELDLENIKNTDETLKKIIKKL